MENITRGQERFICKSAETFRSFALAFLVPFLGAIAYLYVNFSQLTRLDVGIVLSGILLCGGAVLVCLFRYNFYMKQIKELR